jgi:competence protein ComEA
MNAIRLRLAELIGVDQPLNKKLLLFVGALVAGVVFLINGLASVETEPVEVVPSLAADEMVVQNAKLYVHVVGEVAAPGIYQLESGARVMDAIFAAGGLSDRADDASVNLARELSDGEQIVIFKIGAAPSVPTGAVASSGLISLNKASQSELEQLPGVGPALAQRIMDWRLANGGFKKKEDLLNISGIGDKLFSGFKDQVTL